MPPSRPEISGLCSRSSRLGNALEIIDEGRDGNFSTRLFEGPAGCPVVGRDFGAETENASTSPLP
jgi:hypothetical protein